VVDEGRLARLLRAIAERTDRLAGAAASPTGRADQLWLDGVKYLFLTTIEACVDVAHHIAASERLGAPDTNAAAIRLLGEHGIIDEAIAHDLARAVGFRNVLVHQYTDVDDRVVLDALDRLGTFRAFVTQVSAWLLAHGDASGA
jgi:uncharacterized protein YutE (UPF0331/DUF86 family)